MFLLWNFLGNVDELAWLNEYNMQILIYLIIYYTFIYTSSQSYTVILEGFNFSCSFNVLETAFLFFFVCINHYYHLKLFPLPYFRSFWMHNNYIQNWLFVSHTWSRRWMGKEGNRLRDHGKPELTTINRNRIIFPFIHLSGCLRLFNYCFIPKMCP